MARLTSVPAAGSSVSAMNCVAICRCWGAWARAVDAPASRHRIEASRRRNRTMSALLGFRRGVEVRYRPPPLPAPKHDGPASDALAAAQVEGGDGEVAIILHLEVLRV